MARFKLKNFFYAKTYIYTYMYIIHYKNRHIAYTFGKKKNISSSLDASYIKAEFCQKLFAIIFWMIINMYVSTLPYQIKLKKSRTRRRW